MHSTAQSLGEVAKKEKKRREKNQDHGTKVHVVGEDEVSTLDKEPTDPEELAEEQTLDSSLRPSGGRSDKASNPAQSDRRQQEAEWRARVSELKSRLSEAKERLEFLSGLHLIPGEYYVDENGRPVITSLDQLRNMVAEAKTELDAAQKAMDDLREEARKKGVPPGWLR
jgi:hypothetical protein